jgi:hypothetical protein
MRGLDPRIDHLCKICAKKMDPRVTALDGRTPAQIDRELLIVFTATAASATITARIERRTEHWVS